MTPPNQNGNATQQQQEQHERDNNNTEIRARATGQPASNANEFVAIDLVTQNTDMDNASDVNNNNSPSVVNDIRSLAAAVAVDSRATNNVDEVLILHYEHNSDAQNSDNNNNSGVDNEVMHFNGIHIRNNNNSLRNRMNSFISGHTRSSHLAVPPELISDNACAGSFQPRISAINGSSLIVCHHELPLVDIAVTNSEAEVDEIDGHEVEAVRSGNVAGEDGGDGDGAESIHMLFGPQHAAMATPTSRHLGSVNSAIVQISSGDVAAYEYLQQQMQHNSRRRSRRRRRPRGRRGRGGRQQRNEIRSSLKSMTNFMRKTAYTLRRIRSLIMQQVQMARDYHLNLPTPL